ncbi:MAG: S24/S26 family peptidase [Desulfuromonadales bacterium]|nr:S24/S26 family peptidase [Desulfuromonadales bacterium]
MNVFRYTGLSMWPSFQDDDQLVCRPAMLTDIQIGDCVLYRLADQRLAVHRVVGKDDGMLITRGDNLANCDRELVGAHQLLGIVTGRTRLGQTRRVHGRWRGRIWRHFSRLAGRCDPDRQARGGKLARGLRRFCTLPLHCLWRYGACRQRDGVLYWGIGNLVLAGRTADGTWHVPWPQKLLLDPACIKQRTSNS